MLNNNCGSINGINLRTASDGVRFMDRKRLLWSVGVSFTMERYVSALLPTLCATLTLCSSLYTVYSLQCKSQCRAQYAHNERLSERAHCIHRESSVESPADTKIDHRHSHSNNNLDQNLNRLVVAGFVGLACCDQFTL